MPEPGRGVEQWLRAAVDSSPSGMLMTDASGRLVLVNQEIERLFGYAREELLGRSVEMLVPERYRGRHAGFRTAFQQGPSARAMGAGRDLFGLRKDGSEIPVEIGLKPVATDEGLFVVVSVVDIAARQRAEAERRALEEQLRQAQKMEAVGTLAGGIAHDLNNILAAIIGYGELMEREARASQRLAGDLAELLAAAQRGKKVVERILAFSRRQDSVRVPLDLVRALTDLKPMLRATLPAAIDIRFVVHPDAPRVRADATAVQQVVMNLATNSAQAMPGGGTVEVLVEPFYARDSYVRSRAGLVEGSYAMLSVRDSGGGIPEAVRGRVFEPFFTTKEPGAGSGLGMAIVHAIMRDHQGFVELESEVGHGTEVRCLFPALEGAEESPGEADAALRRGAGERVLLVEDEPSLLRMGMRRLEDLGYRATGQSDATAALEHFRATPDAFDLLVTDYSMRQLTGLDLARAAHAVRPGLPVVMLTGYVEDMPEQDLRDAGIRRVLRKPQTLRELADTLRDVLDAAPPASGS